VSDAQQVSNNGKRLPAPEPLRLVQEFVNTRDVEDERVDLVKPDDLKEFLRARHLISSRTTVTDADLELARTVREAIRALLVSNTGDRLNPNAVRTLNRTAAGLPLTILFEESGPSLEPQAGGVQGALAHILGVVFSAMANGTWIRLKACHRHTCQWAFYDGSKNGSSRWCSMRVCGNREKANAYRERHA